MTTEPELTPSEKTLADEQAFGLLQPTEQLKIICEVKSLKEATLAAVKASVAARQTALNIAAAEAMNPLKEQVRALKAKAMALVTANREAIMKDNKTLEECGQSITYRSSRSVVCDNEKEAVRGLMEMAADDKADDADRMSAEACLKREDPTLAKNFVLKVAAKSAAWLRGFGISVVRDEKLNIKPINTKEDDDA